MSRDINFVFFKWAQWGSLVNFQAYDIADLAPSIISNEEIWVVQTYWQLASRGKNVTASNVPLPGRINVVDGISFLPEYFSPDLFCVGVRGDGHYPGFCQVVIHQNQLVQDDQPAIYLPQWPQPGIIPRSPTRRGVRSLGFLGHSTINLAPAFREPEFVRNLKDRGCELLIRGMSTNRVCWNDYSDIDLVLAVRDIPNKHLLLKPVNKLTNAWIAGVPALVGAEPAMQAITESSLDYILIKQPIDVYHALETFERDPDLYNKMVEHAVRRGAGFNAEAVAGRWLSAIELIEIEHARWSEKSAEIKMMDFDRRVQSHHAHMARHHQEVHASYARRGLGDAWWALKDPQPN